VKKENSKEIICKQDFPLFSVHSARDCKALKLQPIELIPKRCTQRTPDFKEPLWTPITDIAWIYVVPVPEYLTVLCIGQKITGTEVTGSVVNFFVCLQKLWEQRSH
jgi:hypothetical protein